MLVGRTLRVASPLFLLGLASLQIIALADDLKPEDIYKSVAPSVVTLRVEKKQGPGSLGTVFMAVKDGMAVTAWHVVKDAKSVTAKFSNGEEFDVSGLVDKDEKRDVAIVRVKAFGKKLLPVMSDDPAVGSRAYVIGAPIGLEFTISDGLISQIQNIGGKKQYQFSCPASHGNSGGPVVNAKGEVLGIVSWGIDEGQNLNFAVPISYALALDSTLPTTPWDAVRSSMPPAEPPTTKPAAREKLSNDDADRAIADAYVCGWDTVLALEITDLEVVAKTDGFKNGIPPLLYSQQSMIAKNIKRLTEATPEEPNRLRLFALHLERLSNARDAVANQIDAIKEAQRVHGWSNYAIDLLSKKSARVDSFRNSGSDITAIKKAFEEVKKSAAFQDAITPDGMYYVNEKTGDQDFMFGASTWTRDLAGLVIVPKGTLADKLGFQSGDILVSVEGQEKAKIPTLKKAIFERRGKNLLVVVERDRKKKELKLRIPAELPPYPKP